MLYLFNSAYRPLYLKNVLNTLFLPEDSTNEYRYRIKQNVDEQIKSAVKRMEETMITFVDRFSAGGYRYHPIRKGKLLLVRQELEQLFFRVELGEFIYPIDPELFQQLLLSSIGTSGIPKLTNNDPKHSHDGLYAIHLDQRLDSRAEFETGESGWVKAVDALNNTQAFQSSSNQMFVFAKASIAKRSTPNKPLRPRLKNDLSIYRLHQNELYDLKINYVFPIQRSDQTRSATIEVQSDDTLRCLDSPTLLVNSYSNSLNYAFTIKRHLEESKGALQFVFKANTNQSEAHGAERPLIFELRNKPSFWALIIAALLVYSVSTFIVGTDWSQVWPLNFSGLIKLYHMKLVAVLVQTVALVVIFRLLGKKIL